MSAPEMDLFPGFDARMIDAGGVRLFCRLGGSGPALLMLHGFPQSHAMWHRIAAELARHFTLVIPDLRGYGASDAPEADASLYSKQQMAQDVLQLMHSLGHERFKVCGHDRGARVTYRLALDHPEAVSRAAVLDILPTHDYWARMDRQFALKVYHWSFLAQPAPLPETLIGGSPDYYIDHTMASWTAEKSLAAFTPAAMKAYRDAFRQPARIHAMCQDYRAGATTDLEHDGADIAAGRQIACPLLALWGTSGIAPGAGSPLDVWRRWAPQAEGQGISAGHFLAEENPEATLAALMPFLQKE